MVNHTGLRIDVIDRDLIAALRCRGRQRAVLTRHTACLIHSPLAVGIRQSQRVLSMRDGDGAGRMLAMKIDRKAAASRLGTGIICGRYRSRSYRTLSKIRFIGHERGIDRTAIRNRRIEVLADRQLYAVGVLISILGHQRYFLRERKVLIRSRGRVFIRPFAVCSLRHGQRSAIHRAGIGRSVSRGQCLTVGNQSSGLSGSVSSEAQSKVTLKAGDAADRRFSKVRTVIFDVHRDGAARRGAVHVRHGHGKVMGNLRAPFGLITMLRGILGQLVGERQLARRRVEARYRQDAFIRGNRVAAGRRAVFKHGHAVNLDAGHAVGRADGQRAFGRGGRSGLPGLRAVVKTGFVDRQLVRTGFGVTRRHHDVVVHAVDGDEHGTRGNVAVRIRIGVRELFRQLLVVRKRLHRLIVVIERVAVGAVFVQRDCTVLALLRRVRPRKVRAVRTGCRACKGVAIDGSAASFRHIVPEALDGGHVVGDLDTDHSRAAVAVAVRHHHFHFVGDGIVFAATLLAVFLGGLVQRIGIGQIRAVKAGHVQVPLIRLDGIARQDAVLPDDDAADGDGRHAVRGGDAHAAVGRRGAPAAAAIQGGFVHLEHIVRHGRRKIFSLDGDVRIIRIRAGSGRRHGHAVVVLIIRARLHRICGQLHAAVEADVQTPQMVEAVQQVAAAVFVVAAAA